MQTIPEPRKSNFLYHSYYPATNQNTGIPQSTNLKLSFVSMNDNNQSRTQNNQSSGKSLMYKYKRVNNMFKLVPIDQNNCEQGKCNGNNIGILEREVKILSLKVTELQKKQNEKKDDNQFGTYMSAVHQQIQWLSERDQEIQLQLNSTKSEVSQMRQRLEQMEECTFTQEQRLGQLNGNFIRTQKSIQHLSSEFLQRLQYKTQQLVNNLSEELNKKFQQLLHEPKNEQKIYYLKSQSNSSISTSMSPKAQQDLEIFSDKILHLKHHDSYEVLESNNQYLMEQKTYHIDSKGRLYDSSGYQILNQINEQIFLRPQHIKKLQSFGIFEKHIQK